MKHSNLKRCLYRDLNKFYNKLRSLEPSKAIANDTELVGKTTCPGETRKQLLNFPDIPKEAANILAKESNIINTLGWIRRRINVVAGMDPITLNDVIVGGLIREGWPATLAVRFLRLPTIQSQTGIWLANTAPTIVQIQTVSIAAKNLFTQ